jgi:hypothetical protein
MSTASDEDLDALILSHAGEHWRKVAMVIARVLEEFERAGTSTSEDQYRIADRIEALVEAGKLQAAGNVALWRHSEVRLPDERSRSSGNEVAEERLVFVYFNGTAFSFGRAHEHSLSVFGGPVEYDVSGIAHGPEPLHMVARLSAVDLRGPKKPLFDIPLIYGMCYDGCELEYRVDGRHIDIRRMSPTESSGHWPYPHYPALLPYVPLKLGETRPCSYAEFAEPFSNMPESQPTELVAVVPSPATLGVSLWGWAGDGDVILLFECDLADRTIYASNRCS